MTHGNCKGMLVRVFIFAAVCTMVIYFIQQYSLERAMVDDMAIEIDDYSGDDDSDLNQTNLNQKTFNPTLNTKKNERWIVITTILNPSNDIRLMAELIPWTLVIVADTKTPKNWTYKNCVFLSVEAQRKLNYGIVKLIPFRSYQRKVIGYLYAIAHGAKFIYDTDDDNLPIRRKLESFDYSKYTSGLLFRPTIKKEYPAVLNSYAHFGRSDVWPRGFPLDLISQEVESDYNLCTKMITPLIQQGLVDIDADVDAIYRLVFVRDKIQKLLIKFDAIAPPVALPSNSYCPFNSQNTLFHYDAFWALPLPITVSFRATDIWRGYVAQRLLHLIGNYMGFYGPNARQIRNPHSYLKDFMDEIQIYTDTSKLLPDLEQWSCTSHEFIKCFLELSEFMSTKGYWGKKDFEFTKVWIKDLQKIKYRFPSISKGDNTAVDINSCSNKVRFVSNADKRISRRSVIINSLKTLNQFCNSSVSKKLQFSGFSDNIYNHTDNVFLVVTVSQKTFIHIPLMQILFHPWYANVIFCGHNIDKADKDVVQLLSSKTTFSYINLTHQETDGADFSYICLKKVADMKTYNADGYLVISDDTLLNFWTWYDVIKVQLNNICCEKVPTQGEGAEKWNNRFGNPSLKILEQFINKNKTIKIHPDMLSTLKKVLLLPISCTSKVYYVPQKNLYDYQTLSQIFFDHNISSEFAVPKILSALGWVSEYKAFDRLTASVTNFEGKCLKNLTTDTEYLNFFDKFDVFLQPVNMLSLTQPASKNAFCNSYITPLFDVVSER